MRTVIVGGGPGGLFLALLLKQSRRQDEVIVLERNRPDDSFGFGVVFSDRTMRELAAYDAALARDLSTHAPRWSDIEIRHPGGTVRAGGHGFTSIARRRLLALLQGRARDAGVDLRFGAEITGPGGLPEHDLLVGADGVNSSVRTWYAHAFNPRIEVGRAYFMWCGSTTRYDCLTFIFAESQHGAFGVHAYPYEEAESTFLVETDEACWRAAGFDRHEREQHPAGWSDDDSINHIAGLFAPALDGGALLGNNSRWQRFSTVRTSTWRHERVVLLGDAAHTAHFSVGSGTRMALQDAGELSRALRDAADIDSALQRYEDRRRPPVEAIQEAARPSMAWWERFGTLLGRQAPPQFAFNFLTRVPKLTRDVLKRRDRSVVEQVDEWWSAATGVAGGSDTLGLEAPLLLRGQLLPNRVVVERQRTEAVEADRRAAVELEGAAVHGAGLVCTGLLPAACLDGAAMATWEPLVRGVRSASQAVAALQLQATLAAAEALPGLFDAAAACGFAGIELDLLLEEDEQRPASAVLVRLRRRWPQERFLAARITVAGPSAMGAVDRAVQQAEVFAEAGCDLLAVAVGQDQGPVLIAGDWPHLLASERIRTEIGLPTMLVEGVGSDDAANTALLAGRADLCSGSPLLGSARWRRRQVHARE